MNVRWPRPLDHCVLPTADLDIARERLAALGFTVAPRGDHPFGTANRCVYIADGSFLEMLVTANQAVAEAAAERGNVFASHQLEAAPEGFSALVLKTEDARADHASFVEAGVSAGDMLDFSREFSDASGNAATASFRLAFAEVQDASSVLVFTCQRIAVPKVDQSALQNHMNGVVAINSVAMVGSDPIALDPLLSAITAEGDGLSMQIFPIDPWNFAAATFEEPVRLAAITFATQDLGALQTLLDANAIDYVPEFGGIAVPPAPGQGATFIFEARS